MQADLKPLPASQVAPALGFADWSTPLSAYLGCRRQRAFDANPDAPLRGIRLAPALRMWASDILGEIFQAPRNMFVGGGRLSHLAAQPDGVTIDGKKVLILRTPRRPEEWAPQLPEGVEEDDEAKEAEVSLTGLMPLPERLECAVVQALLQPEEVWVGAMMGAKMTMRLYRPNADTEAKVLTTLNLFWQRYVKEERPPGAQKGDEATLRELFPRPLVAESRPFDSLTIEQREAVVQWAGAQRRRVGGQSDEKLLRPKVLQAIGDSAGIKGPFPPGSGLTAVSCDSRDPYPNNGTWKAIAEECLGKMSPRSKKRMLEKYTPVVGTRVLRPFFDKAKKSEAA